MRRGGKQEEPEDHGKKTREEKAFVTRKEGESEGVRVRE